MPSIDPAVVSGLSAVLGSLVGGLASVMTAWFTQRTQGRRELLTAEIRKREILYTEFIAECSRLRIDSLQHTIQSPETVVNLYALDNRIKLTSSEPVLAAVEQVLGLIITQYYQPNLTLDEIRELATTKYADPLKAFSSACRAELEQLRRSA